MNDDGWLEGRSLSHFERALIEYLCESNAPGSIVQGPSFGSYEKDRCRESFRLLFRKGSDTISSYKEAYGLIRQMTSDQVSIHLIWALQSVTWDILVQEEAIRTLREFRTLTSLDTEGAHALMQVLLSRFSHRLSVISSSLHQVGPITQDLDARSEEVGRRWYSLLEGEMKNVLKN